MINATTRSIADAVLRACFPAASDKAIGDAIDLVAFAAVAAEPEGQAAEPAGQEPEPAADGLPPVPEGGEVVVVERFFDKEWPDSGRVRSLVMRRPDGSEVKAKFNASKEAAWKAAASALGVDVDVGWQDVQGQQAVVVIATWNPPDGGDAVPVVRRWVARPGSPRAVEKAADAAAKAERAAKRSRNAVPEAADPDDIGF